jgi:hypothetical protein
MAAQGTTTIDFGAAATDTSVAVSSPTIGAGNLVEAWIFPAATASNTVDNHWVENIKVVAGNVQAGVGFTIWAKCDEGVAHGVYNVGWVWN